MQKQLSAQRKLIAKQAESISNLVAERAAAPGNSLDSLAEDSLTLARAAAPRAAASISSSLEVQPPCRRGVRQSDATIASNVAEAREAELQPKRRWPNPNPHPKPHPYPNPHPNPHPHPHPHPNQVAHVGDLSAPARPRALADRDLGAISEPRGRGRDGGGAPRRAAGAAAARPARGAARAARAAGAAAPAQEEAARRQRGQHGGQQLGRELGRQLGQPPGRVGPFSPPPSPSSDPLVCAIYVCWLLPHASRVGPLFG